MQPLRILKHYFSVWVRVVVWEKVLAILNNGIFQWVQVVGVEIVQ